MHFECITTTKLLVCCIGKILFSPLIFQFVVFLCTFVLLSFCPKNDNMKKEYKKASVNRA